MINTQNLWHPKEIDREVIGYCPYITFGMLEVRGVGIIDVTAIYGLSSVLEMKRLDLIIELEHWDDKQSYDRLGIEDLYKDVLGVKIKLIRTHWGNWELWKCHIDICIYLVIGSW